MDSNLSLILAVDCWANILRYVQRNLFVQSEDTQSAV